MAERESAAETTEEEEEEEELLSWNRETVPRVLKIVVSSSTRGGGLHLSQKDLISLLLVSPWLYRTLVSYPSLWLVLDLHEMSNSGDRLLSALSLERYKHVKHINLEFARDVGDEHFEILKSKCFDWFQSLESINLNGCQKISDKGIEAITTVFHSLKFFSIYWNVRVTDIGMRHLVRNCKHILNLNLSGCKNISDETLQLIADNYRALESLDITRCVKVTDTGLCQILLKCSSLRSLNLYTLSSFTDRAYNNIASLGQLRFLDLCGAQNLTDEGLSCIAKCKHLVSLNLTWCVRVTDKGVNAIACGCTSLEFLSLFGIIGVTDKCLELLSRFCSSTLTTLDVNGCIGIKRRSREELLKLFPQLRCFKVHS